ncbi:MAG: ABC transporter ATP-binding protein [Nitrospinaceae bacterium]|jgi:putative ABC transport system ATP-binding protein|nr:ABC transporter ATP-binding protein [Nitrospinaceae bacterium]MBT4094751.1 ABC transporter ATP-binding protein [Nitrospinaceae bacterium]
MSLILARDIVKTYSTGEIEVQALRKVSFEILEGSFVAFAGPSGSGKTTLLNLIGCLDKPTAGGLVVAEMAVARLNRIQGAKFRGENIGFIFQNFNLMPVLTAFENIEYPLTMVQTLPVQERTERVTELLEAVGMADQRNKYPEQLSGGQKQRVAVARALVTRPKLVLADEPTANLDHDTAHIIIQLMKKMTEEFNTTFIFSTHDSRIIGEAEVVYTLEDGRITNREVAHA